MSVQRLPGLLNFHRSASMPCPYIDGKFEQQVFVELSGNASTDNYNKLSRAGFRRSHHIVYKPSCCGCTACIPVRIAISDFKLSKSWRRILNRNSHLKMTSVGANDSDEQFDLFSQYVKTRHWDGEMATMNRHDYKNLVTASPVETSIYEFRDDNNDLIAACLTDELDDGLSAVYSFFNPAIESSSPGSYMILKLIELAKLKSLSYIYLGFWIEDSQKMSYKTRFKPLEAFKNSRWSPID